MRIALLAVVIAGCGGAEPAKKTTDPLCGLCSMPDGSSEECCADPGASALPVALACTWNTGPRLDPRITPPGDRCPDGQAEEVCTDLTSGAEPGTFGIGCRDPHAFECYANHGTGNPSCCYDPKATGWDGESFHQDGPCGFAGNGCGRANCL